MSTEAHREVAEQLLVTAIERVIDLRDRVTPLPDDAAHRSLVASLAPTVGRVLAVAVADAVLAEWAAQDPPLRVVAMGRAPRALGDGTAA